MSETKSEDRCNKDLICEAIKKKDVESIKALKLENEFIFNEALNSNLFYLTPKATLEQFTFLFEHNLIELNVLENRNITKLLTIAFEYKDDKFLKFLKTKLQKLFKENEGSLNNGVFSHLLKVLILTQDLEELKKLVSTPGFTNRILFNIFGALLLDPELIADVGFIEERKKWHTENADLIKETYLADQSILFDVVAVNNSELFDFFSEKMSPSDIEYLMFVQFNKIPSLREPLFFSSLKSSNIRNKLNGLLPQSKIEKVFLNLVSPDVLLYTGNPDTIVAFYIFETFFKSNDDVYQNHFNRLMQKAISSNNDEILQKLKDKYPIQFCEFSNSENYHYCFQFNIDKLQGFIKTTYNLLPETEKEKYAVSQFNYFLKTNIKVAFYIYETFFKSNDDVYQNHFNRLMQKAILSNNDEILQKLKDTYPIQFCEFSNSEDYDIYFCGNIDKLQSFIQTTYNLLPEIEKEQYVTSQFDYFFKTNIEVVFYIFETFFKSNDRDYQSYFNRLMQKAILSNNDEILQKLKDTYPIQFCEFSNSEDYDIYFCSNIDKLQSFIQTTYNLLPETEKEKYAASQFDYFLKTNIEVALYIFETCIFNEELININFNKLMTEGISKHNEQLLKSLNDQYSNNFRLFLDNEIFLNVIYIFEDIELNNIFSTLKKLGYSISSESLKELAVRNNCQWYLQILHNKHLNSSGVKHNSQPSTEFTYSSNPPSNLNTCTVYDYHKFITDHVFKQIENSIQNLLNRSNLGLIEQGKLKELLSRLRLALHFGEKEASFSVDLYKYEQNINIVSTSKERITKYPLEAHKENIQRIIELSTMFKNNHSKSLKILGVLSTAIALVLFTIPMVGAIIFTPIIVPLISISVSLAIMATTVGLLALYNSKENYVYKQISFFNDIFSDELSVKHCNYPTSVQ